MVAAGLTQTQAQIIIEQIQLVQKDEQTHADTLSTVIKSLGATPFNGCSFNFQGTLNDPATFLSVARSLEQVGVSAYLGAAALLTDKALLTAAGSILTLEARHQSLLNTFNAGEFSTQPFDLALSPTQVLALAGGFLQNCNAAQLSLTTNQPLSVTERVGGTTRIQIGSQLNFASTVNLAAQAQTLSCQMLVGGASVALVFAAENCVVPNGINGPVAVFLTNSSEPLQSNLQTQNSKTIVVGPALVFVDSQATTLGSLFTIQTPPGQNGQPPPPAQNGQPPAQNGQKQNNQNGGFASADLGGYYQAMKQNGNTKSVTVVKKTVTTTTTTIIKDNGNKNNQGKGNAGGQKNNKRMSRRRRGRGHGPTRY
ncbi:hypothetical protein P7C70_g6778, partial [Phenoliferia sp. Uapishka_3]